MTEKDFVYITCCRDLDRVRSELNSRLEKFYSNSKNVCRFLDVGALISEVNVDCKFMIEGIEEVFK